MSGITVGAIDQQLVTVVFGDGRRRRLLGTAAQALVDPRTTAPERAAVLAVVRALALLRSQTQLNGIDDAGMGVTLVLRDSDANKRGPWATSGEIHVGTRNALASRIAAGRASDVLLPDDAALHELTHVVQFARMPARVAPNEALLEGVADAVAMLATGDDLMGEAYWSSDHGAPTGAIRALGRDGAADAARRGVTTLATSMTVLRDAQVAGAEPHAAGGVVASVVQRVRDAIGRDDAMALVWRVIRDSSAWSTGGSWSSFADALRRASTNPRQRAAVDDALAACGFALQ